MEIVTNYTQQRFGDPYTDSLCQAMQHYPGQRLSLQSHGCTIRYIGNVADKAGDWLGVEWDDPSRGKNAGSHQGQRYFKCRSSSSTAASFLRPSQPWDQPRTFLQALEDKYFKVEEAKSEDSVFVSKSKQIEEVGFEKFALRQAQLKGIHTLVLSHMCIRHDETIDTHAVARICAHITDLDLGDNLFESFDDITALCALLPKLRRLVLDGNQFSIVPTKDNVRQLQSIRMISLSRVLLDEAELSTCMRAFPNVEEVVIANNALQGWHSTIPHSIHIIDLSSNEIQSLEQIAGLLAFSKLRIVILKNNHIHCVSKEPKCRLLSSTVTNLDLGYNKVATWDLIDHLPDAFPVLQSLRVTGNPLYSNLQSPDGKSLASQDGFMLTIARLSTVTSLNYSDIREKDRLDAEKYYLSQIALEISRSSSAVEDVTSKHPRWTVLCEEYGEPVIDRLAVGAIDPGSLAARLVTINFWLAQTDKRWSSKIPRAYNMYALYGLVGKHLGVMPVNLRLIWETGEQDPVSQNRDYQGPEWWDSDEEETNDQAGWTSRLVELVPGTRSVGTYLEGRDANVRVEVLAKSDHGIS